MTRQAAAIVGLTAVVSFLLGLVSAGTRPGGDDAMARPVTEESARPLMVTTAPLAGRAPAARDAAGVDFASVVERLNPAVVNVDSAARAGEDRSRFPQRYQRSPGDGSNSPSEGSGSGFIIDPAGYVLTNYHVIEGADRLTVTLSDGRALRATVVGIDPAIDVALLYIPARSPLPVAPLGLSDTLRVGEWVCAIGNPLGYVHSVTVGVVSFIGRKVFDPSLDALIQTDAAITFGNSGGPLINSRGEVVGMTTAVSALASNIGFAIPIDQIVEVLPQLKETGRVARGFMGVGLTTVTPALQRALRLGVSHGALVQEITPNHPADRAGLRTYDVILRVDEQSIASDEELIRYISAQAPGSLARVEVWRDGRREVVAVKLTERPLPAVPRPRPVSSVRPATGSDQGPLGLTVSDLDPATMAQWRIPSDVRGVRVVRVDSAGPARVARISEGQVILEFNRTPVTSAEQFAALVAALEPGQAVALLVLDRLSDSRVIATVVPDREP